MSKKSIVMSIITTIFIVYIAFMTVDMYAKYTGTIFSLVLKFSTIILCLILAMLIGNDGVDKKDTIMVIIARCLTLISDFLMVILYWNKWGIAFFATVQFTYIIRHSRGAHVNNKALYRTAIIFIFLLLIALNLKPENLDKDLLILGVTYATLLITSLVAAFRTLKVKFFDRTNSYMIAIGMFLFFMCDLNVALFNIVDDRAISFLNGVSAQFLVGFLIWFFYVPSQVLLTLSGYNKRFLDSLCKIKRKANF